MRIEPTMRKLGVLLHGLIDPIPAPELDIRDVVTDSREVGDGDLFVALKGTQVDGRDYIADAISRGASAVLTEPLQTPPDVRPGVPVIALVELRSALDRILSRFFSVRPEDFTIIAVTGTNGKTTCAYWISQAMGLLGRRCAYSGTIGVGMIDQLNANRLTTPGIIELYRMLGELKRDGIRRACMEVSSHALHQDRIGGLKIESAVFTNLSHEHLDYHGDYQSYGNAKLKLFVRPGLSNAVINTGDSFGRRIRRQCVAGRVISYGSDDADFSCMASDFSLEGTTLRIRTASAPIDVDCRIIGELNVPNLLAVVGLLAVYGFDNDQIQTALSQLTPVPGRMETFASHLPRPLMVVDYAHTPDALEKVLLSLRRHTAGKLWCVFGCGGGRDRLKRAKMGAVAEALADNIVITNDNPRWDNPEDIVAEIESGMEQGRHRVIYDRRQAIVHALEESEVGDIVLVAGKGHEEIQQIGSKRLPFSDRSVVRELLGEAA